MCVCQDENKRKRGRDLRFKKLVKKGCESLHLHKFAIVRHAAAAADDDDTFAR